MRDARSWAMALAVVAGCLTLPSVPAAAMPAAAGAAAVDSAAGNPLISQVQRWRRPYYRRGYYRPRRYYRPYRVYRPYRYYRPYYRPRRVIAGPRVVCRFNAWGRRVCWRRW